MDNMFGIPGGLAVVGLAPSNLASAALTSSYQRVGRLKKLTAIVLAAVGTAGEDPVLSFKQATDSSGTGAKAVSVRRCFYRVGTDIKGSDSTLVAAASDDSAISSLDTAAIDGGESQLLIIVEVDIRDLDRANGFNHFAIAFNDTGTTAKWATVLYVGEKFYGKVPQA